MRRPYLKQSPAVVGEQHPQRVCAERRAERNHEQIGDRQPEHQDATRRQPTPQQRGGPHMGHSPNEREDTDRGKCGCRQPGGEPDNLGLRAHQHDERTSGKQQHGYTDEHGEAAPQGREDAEQPRVSLHYATST
jgi:hypothetical protein